MPPFVVRTPPAHAVLAKLMSEIAKLELPDRRPVAIVAS